MGRVREINWFLSPYIRTLYALPLIALVPIVILWVGYQPAARLIIVIISVFLPVAVTTADGTRAINKDYLDVGKMFGARTHDVWFGIALPSAIPFIVAGIELGFARGITNAIAVEVLASVNGMGMSVFTKSNELNENASLVYVMCLGDLRGQRALADDPLRGTGSRRGIIDSCRLLPRSALQIISASWPGYVPAIHVFEEPCRHFITATSRSPISTRVRVSRSCWCTALPPTKT